MEQEEHQKQEQQRWNRRSGSIFSKEIDDQTDWNDLFSRMDQQQGTIEDYKKLMYKTQSKRREFVSLLFRICSETNDHQSKGIIEVIEDCIQLLKRTFAILSDSNVTLFQKEILFTNGETLILNVKDEILGIQKDLVFLVKFQTIFKELLNSGHPFSWSRDLAKFDFLNVLAPYHPNNSQEFVKEHSACVSFLKNFITSNGAEKRKPILITDWDGTMKDYCSQYATNLQPIYSALSMAKFSKDYTRLTAVLTAGPLRGPGILDLTSLQKDGPIVFGGSWGREWWMGGKRVVNDEGISDEGLNALERLSDEMSSLLENKEFSHFGLIGSGVQRKVDRLTLGVQTVFNHVHPDLSARYQDEVKERLHRVDPNEQFLHFEPSTGLEVEVIVHSDRVVWNKANGIANLIENLDDSIEVGNVLICGDTHSDIPMIVYGNAKNPKDVMALFVTSDQKLQQRIRDIIGKEDHYCFVSTPDVIHAAMMTILTDKPCNV